MPFCAADADTLDGMDSAEFATADVVPSGAIMLFDLAACPVGWSELPDAQGRAIVGMPAGGNVKGTVGTALSDMEDRAHAHTVDPSGVNSTTSGAHSHTTDIGNFSSSSWGWPTIPVQPSSSSYYVPRFTGSSGHSHSVNPPPTQSSTNGNHAHGVDIPPTNSTAAATSDVIPYIQLLVCKKS